MTIADLFNGLSFARCTTFQLNSLPAVLLQLGQEKEE